ncbi:MAG TPA: hypothetical protein VGH74_21320 [Planctomycetaceae bacterium]
MFFDDGKLAPWQLQQQAFQGRPKPLEKNAHELRPFHFQYLGSPASAEWRLPQGHYGVSAFLVAEHSKLDAINGNERLDVLGGLIGNIQAAQNLGYMSGEFVVPFSDWLDKETDRETHLGARERNEAIMAAQPRFDVAIGDANVTHLPLNARLIESVRDFLEFTK